MNRQKNDFAGLLVEAMKRHKKQGRKVTLELYDETRTLILRDKLGAK